MKDTHVIGFKYCISSRQRLESIQLIYGNNELGPVIGKLTSTCDEIKLVDDCITRVETYAGLYVEELKFTALRTNQNYTIGRWTSIGPKSPPAVFNFNGGCLTGLYGKQGSIARLGFYYSEDFKV